MKHESLIIVTSQKLLLYTIVEYTIDFYQRYHISELQSHSHDTGVFYLSPNIMWNVYVKSVFYRETFQIDVFENIWNIGITITIE